MSLNRAKKKWQKWDRYLCKIAPNSLASKGAWTAYSNYARLYNKNRSARIVFSAPKVITVNGESFEAIPVDLVYNVGIGV